MNERPCTAEEIDAYFQFASLPLQERRRKVFERMIETMPGSPFVHDLLTGRIEMPKSRIRKLKPRSLSVAKSTTTEPKATKSKVTTKVTLPFRPNPNIDFDD